MHATCALESFSPFDFRIASNCYTGCETGSSDITSNTAHSVVLGATVYPANTNTGYSDATHDKATSLFAGTTQYHRSFSLPTDLPTGTYDVQFEVWADSNGNGHVDPSVDHLLGSFRAYGLLTVQPPIGSIFTTITPQAANDAGAMWRVDGGNWSQSGSPVTGIGGLAVGNHTVSFKLTPGWITPPDQVVSVSSNQTTNVTGTYTIAPVTGSVQVTISPQGALNNGAQWQLDNGEFQNSGSVVSGVVVGTHTVTFSSVSGYTAPPTQTVTVNTNQTAVITGIYSVTATPSRLGNISTRGNVGTEDKVMIGGFIVTGPVGSTKKVMLRGIGPSLSANGVPIAGRIVDPLLELHEPDGTIVTNDNWADSANKSDIPSGFQPTDSREPVIVTTLAPGEYTVIMKGAHDETGVGLVEAYDLDQASLVQLANISTRGSIQTGDNVMIGGFIVTGPAGSTKKVMLRGMGPSLSVNGVPIAGRITDPLLELHEPDGTVVTNDNWADTANKGDIPAGFQPSDGRESVIVTTLPPGEYTVIMKGAHGETGIGLVEAYQLD